MVHAFTAFFKNFQGMFKNTLIYKGTQYMGPLLLPKKLDLEAVSEIKLG